MPFLFLRGMFRKQRISPPDLWIYNMHKNYDVEKTKGRKLEKSLANCNQIIYNVNNNNHIGLLSKNREV